MPTSDPLRAQQRFARAIGRFMLGLEAQRARVLQRSASASRLIPESGREVIDLRDPATNDLDYYVYELGRLHAVAVQMLITFDRPASVSASLADFDAAVPLLSRARDPLTHASDDARLDDVAWLDSLVRLLPGGGVEYLVDPRYGHHDAGLRLAHELLAFLASVGPLSGEPDEPPPA